METIKVNSICLLSNMVAPMSSSDLSKDEADAIYRSPKIIVSEGNAISWDTVVGPSQKIFVDVITENRTELKVQGWYNWKGSKRYSFALIYRKTIPIRRWDDKKGHPDKCTGVVLNGPHKHYHHPDFGDSCAKEVSDIRLGDVNGAFLDFLKECNISLGEVSYQSISLRA